MQKNDPIWIGLNFVERSAQDYLGIEDVTTSNEEEVIDGGKIFQSECEKKREEQQQASFRNTITLMVIVV